MKPALTYHGGKQTIASEIVSKLPDHKVYIEPFCGGASVLFAKPYRKGVKEVICDKYDALVTFYKVLRDPAQGKRLIELLELTPFAEAEYMECRQIIKDGGVPDIEIARAVFVCCMQSFGHSMLSGFAREKDQRRLKTFRNRIAHLTACVERMKHVEVWRTDALEAIPYFDSPDTLFYCDPPYIGTNCGHYGGYTEDDYQQLLDALSGIQGKFILSGYPNDYADAMGFYTHDIKCSMGMNNIEGKGATIKTERLWANFPLDQQLSLFGYKEAI